MNPEEIEDIEIVKGPSAATLYGTDAANGVIVITTKKGRAGPTRWTYYGETGAVEDRNNYASQYALCGHTASGATTRCVLETVALGSCTPDSLLSFNPLLNSSITPIHLGHRDEYGAQASGGTDAVRYFVCGDLENESGPIKMPGFAQNWLDSVADPTVQRGLPRSIQETEPSRERERHALAQARPERLDGVHQPNQRLPQMDNNSTSYLRHGAQQSGLPAEPGLPHHSGVVSRLHRRRRALARSSTATAISRRRRRFRISYRRRASLHR